MIVIVYEITIEVRNFCVRILFRKPPTLGRICECINTIFEGHTQVKEGMIELLLSIGDDEDRRAHTFEVGDRVNFSENNEPIGFMELQTRKLFDG